MSAAPAKTPVTQVQLPGPGSNGQLVFPERPTLAPGVKLAGPMKDSAFMEPPWLIEREGAGYVQVPEVLYRIAEQCDGTHTVDEISAAVSESTGQKLPPDAVQRLITGQLIQKGLVATGDGKVAVTNRAVSPLALNMRMAMIDPGLVDPIARVLQILYWPPVLIAVLAVGAFAEIWLYAIHGVGASLHDTMYAPGLMLVLLAVIVVSAAFHELGHAAALRYGGGRVKAMGAGLYLVYPAFYTDVSDNYRLPRWARLRTDLGGFYFNLIFALGAMGVYFATGHEFLLLIVVLINLEILHQLFPFLRLDGYWTLVDMTGVPDFFSQMAAFVRRYIPGLRGSGPRLPELKWWANLVFGLYMLITIPLLAFLFFVAVKGLPRIVATAWDSFQQQKELLGTSFAGGDMLGVATASVNALTLALPTVGMALALSTTVRRVYGALWRWSATSLPRRTATLLGTVVATAGMLLLWAPDLPFATGTPGPLYAQASFEPIKQDEQLTIGEIGLPGPPPRAPARTQEPSRAAAGVSDETPTAAPTSTATPDTSTPEPTSTSAPRGTQAGAQSTAVRGGVGATATRTPTSTPASPTLAAGTPPPANVTTTATRSGATVVPGTPEPTGTTVALGTPEPTSTSAPRDTQPAATSTAATSTPGRAAVTATPTASGTTVVGTPPPTIDPRVGPN